jgi:hypothetical protein
MGGREDVEPVDEGPPADVSDDVVWSFLTQQSVVGKFAGFRYPAADDKVGSASQSAFTWFTWRVIFITYWLPVFIWTNYSTILGFKLRNNQLFKMRTFKYRLFKHKATVCNFLLVIETTKTLPFASVGFQVPKVWNQK